MSSKNDLECIRTDFSDIDDKTVIKYFEIALDDIRNIEVSDERKKSRAKRLGLSKDFNRWNWYFKLCPFFATAYINIIYERKVDLLNL